MSQDNLHTVYANNCPLTVLEREEDKAEVKIKAFTDTQVENNNVTFVKLKTKWIENK